MTWEELPAPIQLVYPYHAVLRVRVRLSRSGDLYTIYCRDRYIRKFGYVDDDWRLMAKMVMVDSLYRKLVKGEQVCEQR